MKRNILWLFLMLAFFCSCAGKETPPPPPPPPNIYTFCYMGKISDFEIVRTTKKDIGAKINLNTGYSFYVDKWYDYKKFCNTGTSVYKMVVLGELLSNDFYILDVDSGVYNNNEQYVTKTMRSTIGNYIEMKDEDRFIWVTNNGRFK